MCIYPVMSYHILYYSTLYYPILSYQIIFYPIISYPILSYHIISYPILSYPILSYPILSYPILSYPILPNRCFLPQRANGPTVNVSKQEAVFCTRVTSGTRSGSQSDWKRERLSVWRDVTVSQNGAGWDCQSDWGQFVTVSQTGAGCDCQSDWGAGRNSQSDRDGSTVNASK